MGEHRLAGHVADREDVRLGSTALRVHLDEPARVDLHVGAFEAERGAVGAAADGDEHLVEDVLLRLALVARDAGAHPVARVLDTEHGGLEADLLEAAPQPPL